MINFNDIAKRKRKELNPNRAQVPAHLYRVLIIRTLNLEKQRHY